MLTLLQFIHAREDVRKRREAGMPWPWTDNPILQRYKFCNVRREDDRVTREIARMMRRPHERDRDLWFALLVARRACNWPPTLAELGYASRSCQLAAGTSAVIDGSSGRTESSATNRVTNVSCSTVISAVPAATPGSKI